METGSNTLMHISLLLLWLSRAKPDRKAWPDNIQLSLCTPHQHKKKNKSKISTNQTEAAQDLIVVLDSRRVTVLNRGRHLVETREEHHGVYSGDF